jgi:hypothetical protein
MAEVLIQVSPTRFGSVNPLLRKLALTMDHDCYDPHASPQRALWLHVRPHFRQAHRTTDLLTALEHLREARKLLAVIVSTGTLSRLTNYRLHRAIDKMEMRKVKTDWKVSYVGLSSARSRSAPPA